MLESAPARETRDQGAQLSTQESFYDESNIISGSRNLINGYNQIVSYPYMTLSDKLTQRGTDRQY